jgi:hypothetical protein
MLDIDSSKKTFFSVAKFKPAVKTNPEIKYSQPVSYMKAARAA